jgi:signal transduction histidine kinase
MDGTIITAALTQAQGIAKSLQELSHQLHPTRLRLLGLVTALDRLRVEVSRAAIPIAFSHENVPATLPPEVMPQQVISLLGQGGPSFPLANHADHIHIGF